MLQNIDLRELAELRGNGRDFVSVYFPTDQGLDSLKGADEAEHFELTMERHSAAASGRLPVLNPQARSPAELCGIVCHQRAVMSECDGSDHQVVSANDLSSRGQVGSNLAVLLRGRVIERRVRLMRRIRSFNAEQQFRDHDRTQHDIGRVAGLNSGDEPGLVVS
jgi:hypothetical protein